MDEDLKKDASTKYSDQWERLRDENSSGCLIGLLVIGIAVAITIISAFDKQISSILGSAFFVGFLCFVIYFKYFKQTWKCPRCGKDFDYPYRPRTVKYCVNCGLPQYYGSSRYFDIWGTKDGLEMADKIRRGLL